MFRVLGVVAVLLAGEAAARAVVSTTAPTVEWYDQTTALKVDQMEDLDTVSVVFAGTSSAAQAFVPDVYDFISGDTSYNVALAGGTPDVMERWLVEEVVPRTRPTTVVWGLTSLDVAPEYGDASGLAYNEARATRTGTLAAADRWFSARSVLVRERPVLRSPDELLGDAGEARELGQERAEQTLGPQGERLDFAVDVSAQRQAITEARLANFTVDPTDTERIARSVADLQELGVEVILVELPVPQRFVAAHPNGAADHDRVGVALSELAEEAGVRFLDLSRSFLDSDFVDFTHLDQAAARRFTAIAWEALDSGRSDVVQPDPNAGSEQTAPPQRPEQCETETVTDEYGAFVEICVLGIGNGDQSGTDTSDEPAEPDEPDEPDAAEPDPPTSETVLAPPDSTTAPATTTP